MWLKYKLRLILLLYNKMNDLLVVYYLPNVEECIKQ